MAKMEWKLGLGGTKFPNSYGATKRALSFLHPVSTDEVKKKKKNLSSFNYNNLEFLLQLAKPKNSQELRYSTLQFSSVTQSCPTPCNPMNRSMPGLPVHHQLLEFTQADVH